MKLRFVATFLLFIKYDFMCFLKIQLLDEVADFGVPVITEPSIMSSLIQIPSVMNKVTTYITKVTVFSLFLHFFIKQGTGEEDTWLPGTGNSTVTWRRPDLKYSRNEIRFFIIEYINATVTQYISSSLYHHSIEKVNIQIVLVMVLYVYKVIFHRILRLLLLLLVLILLKVYSFILVWTDLASIQVRLYNLFLQMVFSMYVQ